MQQQQTVVVGMSGGVDSSVSAFLLKQAGYRVIGMFMKNWEETNPDGTCTSAQDYEDVAQTCAHLDIPFYGVNFVAEYRDHVFQHFLAEMARGRTPNPDILCNREIKFKMFYDKAIAMGSDFVATGHYCQTRDGKLLKGSDPSKDQSYFLSAINGATLQRVLFPVGHLVKDEVRTIAREHGIPTHAKKDSTGICFIGERKFRPFVQQYLKPKPGDFRQLDGTIVGKHEGAMFYTEGQRRQLGLGGPGERWYVVKKDMERNIVYVERGEHPELFRSHLEADRVSWIQEEPSFPLSCSAKIRYRQSDQECIVQRNEDGTLHVAFAQPQRAIVAGQTIAFYRDSECLGSAAIRNT